MRTYIHRSPSAWKRKAAAAFAGAALVALGIGTIPFMARVPADVETSPQTTDAIVVLTGGSGRLEAGSALLNEGKAKEMFVSGVHRGVDVAELLKVAKQDPAQIECCIFLGYNADNTIGNARETAAWARRRGIRTLRLVTAAYHMPRSLLEFRAAMPDMTILPHPVFPDHVKLQEWYRYPGTAFLVLGEYAKFLMAATRLTLERAWLGVAFLFTGDGEKAAADPARDAEAG